MRAIKKITAGIAAATIIVSGTPALAAEAQPSMQQPAPVDAQATSPAPQQAEDPHQITSLTLDIANDPRLLALGFTNETAYAGATLKANAVAAGAEKLEYYWLPERYPHPMPDNIEMGPNFVVDDYWWLTETLYNVWVRATWANGEERLAKVPFTTGYATGRAATFKAPASIRPGSTLSGSTIVPSDMATAAGGRDKMIIKWFVEPTDKRWYFWDKPVATGEGPLVVQPSWRGKNLFIQVDVREPLGWTISTSRAKIPIEDASPIPVKVSLPAFAATHPNRAFDAKVTNIPPGTIQEAQWIHNGKVAQDFTNEHGFQYNPPRGSLPGDTLQIKVRSIYKDGTVTPPVASNTVKLSTPAFKAPPVSVTGTATVGQRLTSVRGIGYVPPTVKLSRTWLRDGKPIPGATATTYKLTAADADKRISVRTSYKPFDRAAVASTSKSSGPVKRLLMKSPFLHVTGTARPGYTLSVKALRGKAGSVISYRWLRNGIAIKGATKATYRLSSADAGKRIAVRATVTYPGYKTIVTTSHSKLAARR